ncbi:conjugative transfer signal peptidase TraF [Shewanella colwelliana]|uniref:conjugative transfer signal peptidase TraF n=1 Tax=Shewanella colwelliana TaxID=23 RepID=UPI003735E812
MKTYHNNQSTIDNLKVIAWLTTLLAVLAGLAYLNGYRFNISHSYPPGLYQLEVRTYSDKTGDLVLFCPPNNNAISTAIARGYLDAGRCKSGSVPIIKRIAAIAHDTVTLNEFIHVNGNILPDTTVLTEDSEHRPLTPFTFKGQHQFILPPETAFVYSDYAPETSFDSRYFGFVAVKDIQGIIKPIWTIARP